MYAVMTAAQNATSARRIALDRCLIMISSARLSMVAAAAPAQRLSVPLAQAQIEHLHSYRKGHREVHVALGHVVIEAIGDKHNADYEEKRERQHLDCRVAGDEAADRGGERHHEQQR